MPEKGLYSVRLSDSGITTLASVAALGIQPSTSPQRWYYWYTAGKIQKLQGGFSGRLLNGDYTEYYANKNLRCAGKFSNGLKTGIWKNWRENGTLISEVSWAQGQRNGAFSFYDNNGVLSQSGFYKNDRFNGIMIFYHQDSLKKVRYRSGNIVQPDSVSFFKRIRIFGKKQK